ncbi:MAG: BlaI/MecI/CopY family transcriptional regulator [Salibacteraceae bacterium]
MKSKLKQLTKAEEQVMQHLWELERGFVKDILTRFEEPKPAYNTVSTIVRILEEKGFVAYEAYGKTHQYYPLISKEEYSRFTASNLLKGYFNGSAKELVSFFLKDRKLDVSDLDEILKELSQKENKS